MFNNFASTFFALSAIVLISVYIGSKTSVLKISQYHVFASDEQINSVSNYPVSETVSLNIKNIDGSITIIGHDQPNVVLEVKKVGNREKFQDARVQVQGTENTIAIESIYNNHYSIGIHKRGVALHLTIKVPHKALLESVKNINGLITINGVQGKITAENTNGDITITDSENSLALHTVNGTVTLSAHALPAHQTIDIKTTNGSITCSLKDTIAASLIAKTKNGKIQSTLDTLQKTEKLIGGYVEGQTQANPTSHIKLKTVNGSIYITTIE